MERYNMASKKTDTRKVPATRGTLSKLRKLTKKAQKEIAELLADEQAGTITRLELKTGLECLEEELKQISFFQHRL
jgi:hypothetical protein